MIFSDHGDMDVTRQRREQIIQGSIFRCLIRKRLKAGIDIGTRKYLFRHYGDVAEYLAMNFRRYLFSEGDRKVR